MKFDFLARFLGAFAKLLKATINFVMYICPSDRMENLGSHWNDFHKIWYLSIFHKSVEKINFSIKSSGSRVVPWGQMDGRTDMTNLIVDFRSFAKAPTNFNFSIGFNNQSTKVLCLLKLQVQAWLQLVIKDFYEVQRALWQDRVRMSDLPTAHVFLT